MHSTHWITRATLGWLALGIGALLFHPDALYNQTLGWSASWWLLVAPLLMLGARAVFVPGRNPDAAQHLHAVTPAQAGVRRLL